MTDLKGPGDTFTKLEDLVEHPRKDLVPAATEQEDEDLLADIRKNGVQIPLIVSHPSGRILDGHRRYNACLQADLDEVPVIRRHGLTEQEELELLFGLNTNRRQLSNKQKRQLARNVLKEWTERSDRWMADLTGLSNTFIGSVRNELEMMGEVSSVDSRVGKDGSVRPATKPKKKGHKDGVPAGSGGEKSASKKKGKPATKPKPAPSDAPEDREVEDAADTSDPEPEHQGDEGPYNVECPVCPAIPGEVCMLADGSPGDGLHPERVDSWKEEIGLTEEADDSAEEDEEDQETDDAPPPPEKKRSTLAKDNPEVVGLIEKRLAGRSEPTVHELYDAAKRINPALGDLTVRQFNARYVLQIKRGALGSGAEQSQPDGLTRKQIDRWVDTVPRAPSLSTADVTEALASEPLGEGVCEDLLAVSRFIQKIVSTSSRVRGEGDADPAPEEDEAPEPAEMPV